MGSVSIVILGTLVFLSFVLAVGRGTTWMLRSQAARSTRAMVTVRLTGSMLGEIVFLVLLAVFLKNRSQSFRNLGLWEPAPLRGWIIAAAITALYLCMVFASALRGQARLAEMSAFRVYNSLLAGLTAGFVEEIFFRGFVMSELRRSGFGAAAQVVASALLFGVAHLGWGLFSKKVNWPALVNSIIATAIVGAAYALAYLASSNSLMPVIASHVITDILIEPWLLLAAMSGDGPRARPNIATLPRTSGGRVISPPLLPAESARS